jgi:hypothetical protein
LSYIGQQLSTGVFRSEYFSGDNTTTTFPLAFATGNESSVIVTISGVKQKTDSYVLFDGQIIFLEAPPTGTNNIEVLYLGLSPTVRDDTTFVDKTGPFASAEIPAGDESQRDVSPDAGYFRFNTDINKFEGYNGTNWGSVGGGATGGGSDEVFIENDQIVTANYTIPTGRNAMSTGPIEIADGVEVTVSSGSTWVIL